MVGGKCQDTVKTEFKDLIQSLVESNRTRHHLYIIHRLLSLGLLIDFSFRYRNVSEPNKIGIELDLKEYGQVMFIVDTDTSYAEFASYGCKDLLNNFIVGYNTQLKEKTLLH